MATALSIEGQVTTPKCIREAMQWVPGAPVEFSVNAAAYPGRGCQRWSLT